MAFALLLYRTSRPNIAVLGRLPSGHWVDRERADAETEPGVGGLRIEAGLFFANAGYVRQSILAHAREDGVRAVVVDAQPVPYVDVTAAEMLTQLRDDPARDGVRLVVARDIGQVREVLQRAEDEAVVCPTVEDAVNRVR